MGKEERTRMKMKRWSLRMHCEGGRMDEHYLSGIFNGGFDGRIYPGSVPDGDTEYLESVKQLLNELATQHRGTY